MHRNLIPFASIGLSALACILAAVAVSRGERAQVAASSSVELDDARLEALARQISALRADLESLAISSRESSTSRVPMEKAPEPAVVPPELLARLKGLE